jgi:hypothetical protein
MRSALGLLLRKPQRPASWTHHNAAPCASVAAHNRGARTAVTSPWSLFRHKASVPARRQGPPRRKEGQEEQERAGPLDRPHLGMG